MMKRYFTASLLAGLCLIQVSLAQATAVDPSPAPPEHYVTYKPVGKAKGKYIVFVTGDEEYRSEEGMPQLAKILAKHHGFRCSVHFAVDRKTGEINPNVRDNIPGLETLRDADLMVIFTRFRDLPDEQMQHIVEYTESGKPIIGLRTATHAFNMKKENRKYWHYTHRNNKWKGGFGEQVLGERWVNHHGGHGRESSRGLPAKGMEDHPILRGIAPKAIWDPSDVYGVRLPMQEGIQPLVMGQVLSGMSPDDEPLKAKEGAKRDKNNPMMPVAWLKTWSPSKGKQARVFATTLGASQGFTAEGTRRLLVNACYWALGMEKMIAADSKVDIVGKYTPTPFGFNKFTKGLKPADHR